MNDEAKLMDRDNILSEDDQQNDILWLYGESQEALGLIEVPFWQHSRKATSATSYSGKTTVRKRFQIKLVGKGTSIRTGTVASIATRATPSTDQYMLQLVGSSTSTTAHHEEEEQQWQDEGEDDEDPQRSIHWKGCCSYLDCPKTERSVSTRCSPHTSRTISLYYSKTQDNDPSDAYSIDIDWSHVPFGPTIVKTTLFFLPNHRLSLHLVDEYVNILVLSFDLTSLQEQQHHHVQYIPSLIAQGDKKNDTHYNQEVSYDSRLSSNHQCDWINADILIFAVPPYLQTFSIAANIIQTWISSTSMYVTPSQQQQLQQRNTFMKTMFQFLLPPTSSLMETDNDEDDIPQENHDTALERLWNKLTKQRQQQQQLNAYEDDYSYEEEESNYLQPVSTAALTVTRHDIVDDDEQEGNSSLVCMPTVFTLHSDGTMRKWTMMPNVVLNRFAVHPESIPSNSTNYKDYLLPIAVHKIHVLFHSPADTTSDTNTTVTTSSPTSTIEPFLSPPLPTSREWSPTYDAINFTARFCSENKRYAIALSIRTFHPEKQQHHIYVMVGPTFFNTYGALMEEDKKFTTIVSCYKLQPIPTTASNSTANTSASVTSSSTTSIVSLALKDTSHSSSVSKTDQLVKLYCLYSFYTTKNYDKSMILRTGIVTYDDWLSKPRITKFTSDAILDNLCYSDILYNSNGDSQDDSTMERFYMTLLFKSVHPRPFGELRPLDFIVRKSLWKTCCSNISSNNGTAAASSRMGYRRQLSSGGRSSISIEAETLMVMRQWKVQQQGGNYSKQWQKLVQSVRQEEARYQRPLYLTTTTDTAAMAPTIKALVIRTGYTSLLLESTDVNSTSDIPETDTWAVLLDTLCLSLLQSDSNVRTTIERLIYDIITSASLLSKSMTSELLPHIQKILVGSNPLMRAIMMIAKDFIQLTDSLEETQLLQWSNSLRTKLFIPLLTPENSCGDFSATNMRLTQSHAVVDTAIYISRLHMESYRNLSLARFIVLCSMPTSMVENTISPNIWRDAILNSFRVLLDITTLQWLSSEPYSSGGSSVSSRSSININKGTNTPFHSIKKDNISKLHSTVSLLEAELSRLSGSLVVDSAHKDSAIQRSLSAAYQISTYFHHRIVTSTSGFVHGFYSSDGPMEASSIFSMKFLPPRLLLRALAPSIFVSISSPRNSNAGAANHLVCNLFLRKTVAAECMLKEASFAQKYRLLTDDACKRLREAALDLFESAEKDTALSFVVNAHCNEPEYYDISILEKMTTFHVHDAVRDEDVDNQETLALAIQRLIGLELARCSPQLSTFVKHSISSSYSDSHSLLCSSICRLVQLPSFSSLILSCIRGLTGQNFSIMNLQSSHELVIGLQQLMENFPDGGNLSISIFWVLLRRLQKVSHAIYLLELAERNTADHALILKSALNGIESLLSLPSNLVHPMPEFANLWSSVFRHAAKIQNWDQAFDACRKNPLESRRNADFKRLVAFMVESGASVELLLLPKRVDDDAAFDMYEAIASALTSKAKEENSSLSNDYYSSLYSLFTFLEDWRRSALALDDWHQSKINNPSPGSTLVDETGGEGLHLRLLSLTAVACSNSLALVDDTNVKFLISDRSILDDKYVSRLLTFKDVDQRALIALTSQLLHSDVSWISTTSTFPSGLSDIVSSLCSAGYYFHAIAVALKFNEQSNSDSVSKDFLLTKIARDYLVKNSVKLLKTSIHETTNAVDSVILTRPTRSQLYAASQSCSGANFGFQSDSVTSMELLRTIVCTYARPNNGQAVEVARALLDLGSDPSAALPLWLCEILTGEQKDGVFASSKTSCSPKNPTALMKLYLERGLLLPAVEVVVTLLTGKSDGGLKKRKAATRRIPEKGSIDFIPYAYIDLLYRLIQKAEETETKEVCELASGRRKLEEALQFHFNHLCVSEEAMQSARLLNK